MYLRRHVLELLRWSADKMRWPLLARGRDGLMFDDCNLIWTVGFLSGFFDV